jgi:hypothetical protein
VRAAARDRLLGVIGPEALAATAQLTQSTFAVPSPGAAPESAVPSFGALAGQQALAV